MNLDMWKYDAVYRRMASDPRFSPLIVTAMRCFESMENRIHEQDRMMEYFSNRGYKIVPGYNVRNNQWIGLRQFHPDIIIHTQPYNGIVEHCFSFWKNVMSLHVYSPYTFQFGETGWNWDCDLHNYCWRQYFATESQVELSQRFSRIYGRNARAVGYCTEEEIVEANQNKELADLAWRHDPRKRVIWAPHHSINQKEMFQVSSFLEIADVMLELRDKYADSIVFAFKPHPVLKSKLYKLWGIERTDSYYRNWADSKNSFDGSGAYLPLFAGSDAMIHCSSSFTLEYLYAGKPVQYVYSKTRNPPETGKTCAAALLAHYAAHSSADIETFIKVVVIAGHDTMFKQREAVVDQYLKSPNKRFFSENVVEDILTGLKRI